ncbi:MAG: nucleotide exchange factor GrpE [Vicinamibacterales bacterium]
MSDHQEPTPASGADQPATDPGIDPGRKLADQLQQERDELYDRLLRKSAEFDNFRKRIERERKDFTEWAAAEVLGDLVAVMDDFDRALAADAPPEAQGYKTGVELIHRALAELVRKRGVTPIQALGADFDPHLHQAVAYDAVEGAREGEVVEELRKGYMLGERLLRPSLVKVAKAS